MKPLDPSLILSSSQLALQGSRAAIERVEARLAASHVRQLECDATLRQGGERLLASHRSHVVSPEPRG